MAMAARLPAVLWPLPMRVFAARYIAVRIYAAR
jgi:hypothetical protein